MSTILNTLITQFKGISFKMIILCVLVLIYTHSLLIENPINWALAAVTTLPFLHYTFCCSA